MIQIHNMITAEALVLLVHITGMVYHGPCDRTLSTNSSSH